MKNSSKNRWIALGTLGAMSATTLITPPTPAEASTKGKKNTTLGLGAVTAYGLLKGNKTIAIAGAVGTGIAYSKYRKSKKSDEQKRQEWYRNRYGSNWRNHYKAGI